MAKFETKLMITKSHVEEAVERTNKKINELGRETKIINEALEQLQNSFDYIRGVPSDKQLEINKLKKIRVDWLAQVEKIETDYKNLTLKSGGSGVAGVGAGIAMAAFGPTIAMGVATTFGVASTGTAISTLYGVAASNAALAWLGGGALAAGGGGMAAGNVLLTLTGPIGWAFAGIALLSSGMVLLRARGEKEHLDHIFTLVSKRDKKMYDLASIELEERIVQIHKETNLLVVANEKIQTFGKDYRQMSEEQQYELGSYVNLMNASTQLLVNPILGLQPKYSQTDFDRFLLSVEKTVLYEYFKDTIITLANLLYKIRLDEKESKVLYKALKKNKEFMESLKLSKDTFTEYVFDQVFEVLEFKYKEMEISNQRL